MRHVQLMSKCLILEKNKQVEYLVVILQTVPHVDRGISTT
jgi:hypothetical protein